MKRLDWEDLKIFVALARHGSMRSAGAALGVHGSTVTRRVDHFERKLGVRLFDRRGSQWSLTDAGQSLMQSVHRVEDEIDGIERRLQGLDDRMEGDIRVSLPDVMGTGFLMTELAEFCQKWPDVRLELVPSYDVADLSKREADVAIRVTSDPAENLVGRRLATFAVAVYAAPAYLSKHDPQRAPERCRWLHWHLNSEREVEQRARWFPGVPMGPALGSLPLQAEAAAASMGLAILPCAFGDADPRLKRVPGVEPELGGELWILTHPDLVRSARIRQFLDCVSSAFRRNQADLLGGVEQKVVMGK